MIRQGNIISKGTYLFLIATGIVLFVMADIFLVSSWQYFLFAQSHDLVSDSTSFSSAELDRMKQKGDRLSQNLNRLASPGNAFLLINTTSNTFQLYNQQKMVKNGLCSTGSFLHLEIDSARSWIFETPKGIFRVQSKLTDPVWRKPDWAFLEEGLQPPPAGHPSRFEKGVLGDYALDLGNGYLIHGTLYQRLLGKPVTHGCVRLNDIDLEMVYYTLDVGSKVYIY
jgi:hypothetical protein